jgi:putative ABC transport system substrate-binding protein
LPAALAAKAATSTIPVIFYSGTDPVSAGLVASLNRPGGNLTGINAMTVDLGQKQFGLLVELLPHVRRFGVLLNPTVAPTTYKAFVANSHAAAAALDRSVEILSAATNPDIDAAFETAAHKGIEALLVTANSLFVNRRIQLATLTARHALPTLFADRLMVDAGGLMSYGASNTDLHRQMGVYVGRILKGEKPADLPVMQPTKFEFIINLQTARTLKLTVPATLLALATEVIE